MDVDGFVALFFVVGEGVVEGGADGGFGAVDPVADEADFLGCVGAYGCAWGRESGGCRVFGCRRWCGHDAVCVGEVVDTCCHGSIDTNCRCEA